MQPEVYKFLINGVEVFPHYKNLQKKYSVESGQKFFRVKLEGELKLYGDDYILIKNSSLLTEFTLIIQKKKGVDWQIYYEGTFSKTDCEFAVDKREAKIKLSAKDQYSLVMNNYSTEYNLYDLAPALTPVVVEKRPVLQVYVYEDNMITNFLPSGESWEQEVDLDTMDIIDLFNQAFLPAPGAGGGGTGGVMEIRIPEDSICHGLYTETDESPGSISRTFTSLDNKDFFIAGTVVGFTDGGIRYDLSIYRSSDTTLSNPIYRTYASTTSKYFTITFEDTTEAGTSFEAKGTVYFIFTRLLAGGSVLDDGEEASLKLTPSSFGYIKGYSYAFVSKNCAIPLISAPSSDEPTNYGRAKNGKYFSRRSYNGAHTYPIAKNVWEYTSLWLYLTDTFTSDRDLYASMFYTLKDCVSLGAAISCLLKKIDPSIKHEETEEYSSFFYGSNNPVHGGKLNLFITQKSNLLALVYDTPAKKAPITLESLMNMLKKCFNCYWFIEDNKLKIEHALYFENGGSYSAGNQEVGLDVTKTYDTRNGRPLGYGQNTIEYDKNDLPSRYEFSYMDEVSEAFQGPPIKLTAPYLQQDKTESITAEDFNADIDGMILNSANTNKDGFCLMAAERVINEELEIDHYHTTKFSLTLWDDLNIEYTIKIQNGALSWFNLANFYFTSMPSYTAEYDGYPKVPIRITGITPCMTQDIVVPVDEDPNLVKLVATDIGLGQISEMSIDLTTKQAKISLVYEPE